MYKDIKEIIQHSVIYGFGIYVGKAIGFLMIPVYTRALTPADYGVMELLNLTSYLAGILFSVGISTAVYRFYFNYEGKERDEVISSALLFTGVISIFGTLCLGIFGKQISGLVFKSGDYTQYLRLIFISTLFDMTVIVPSAYIRILRKSILFNIVSISGLALSLFLNIYLIVFLKMGVMGVLWSGIISSASIAAFYLLYTIKKIKIVLSIQKIKMMVKYGCPLMPEALFVFLIHFSNRYFLQHFLSLKDVGIFSLGYKFSIMLPFLVGQPFGLIWSTYRFEIAARENAQNIYSRVLTYLFLLTISFCLFLSIFIKEIVYLAASKPFYGAYHIVPIITLGFVFWALENTFDIGILLKNKTYLKPIIAALAAIISLSMNYLLIPRMGIMGAAIASFLSFFSLTVMSLFASFALYPIPVEWARVFKISFVSVSVYLLSRAIGVENLYLSLFLKSLFLPVFILLLILLKFFNAGEIKKINGLKDRILSFLKLSYTKSAGWINVES